MARNFLSNPYLWIYKFKNNKRLNQFFDAKFLTVKSSISIIIGSYQKSDSYSRSLSESVEDTVEPYISNPIYLYPAIRSLIFKEHVRWHVLDGATFILYCDRGAITRHIGDIKVNQFDFIVH